MTAADVDSSSRARYVVGIDLGTTHCALAYADLNTPEVPPQVFPIPQLIAPGTVEARPLLPSFLYFAHPSEGPQILPWDGRRPIAVGEHARARGADAPARVVSSAKSWLSHPSVDRRGALLPLASAEDVPKVSPVDASRHFLRHLREAWDFEMAKGDPTCALAHQEVVLTVPASFDAAARELTIEAALAAGLEKVTLIEEPQAALYAWLGAQGDQWRKALRVGDILLVVDVGGGTTDFSALAAVEQEGALELVRVAVGDHILLGGDNMDLALAHVVRTKLEGAGKELDKAQVQGLVHACRQAKELLLQDLNLAAAPIVLAGRGSKLLGNSLRTELTRSEVDALLVEGFFPSVAAETRPTPRPRGALTQLGLPYASDPAVTKHLAVFLGRQAHAVEKLEGFTASTPPGATPSLLHPTAILFNGGVMKADSLRNRVVATVQGWLKADGAPEARVLAGADLDLAVARGAAAYGLARRGRGVRIRGGTARSYYVGIESALPAIPGMDPPITALCLAPFGMEEGSVASLPPHELGAVVGEPVRFRFFGSTVRRDDQAGVELERWKEGELDELAPVEVTLPAEGRREGDVVPVRLHAEVTEVGTLLLEAIPLSPSRPNERWRVELSVRSEG